MDGIILGAWSGGRFVRELRQLSAGQARERGGRTNASKAGAGGGAFRPQG